MRIPNLELVSRVLDYDHVTGILRWKISRGTRRSGAIAGNIRESGYITVGIFGEVYYAHKIAWFLYYGVWEEGRLDHIDNVQSHNWISNLRRATHEENLANQKVHVNNSSGYKGVSFNKKVGKFKAYVNHNKVRYNLGHFSTAEEAHEARTIRARELHGEFMRER